MVRIADIGWFLIINPLARSVAHSLTPAVRHSLSPLARDPVAKGQVYGCPIGGTIVREQWTTDGSGSTFIWGYLDSQFKEGMSRQEAESLVTHALALAMAKDGSSGGVIRLVTINEAGTTRRMIHENDDSFPDVGRDTSLGQQMEMLQTYGVRV